MKVFISKNAYVPVTDYLASCGHTVIFTADNPSLGRGVSSHADLTVADTGGGRCIHAPDSFAPLKYPYSAAYCAVFLDSFFIHRLDISADELLRCARERGLTAVNVKQGYARCSCIPLPGNRLITADRGIISACGKHPGIEVLEISPGSVLLPGFEYGFIGGTCGIVDGEVVFNGSLSDHPDREKIRAFIAESGLSVREFPFPLLDVGSVIAETIKIR